ncbi:MAG: UDP-N-acetylenolpyruvoylglucosamine reductase, partial [Atopobium sp.]|nr:UDP-N-acetylenolpyruvoylglucosamine reductase [Atopobium sp.]
ISDTHANFIVNTGNATASDVIALMRRAHDAVQENFDIDLQPEVKLLGFGA